MEKKYLIAIIGDDTMAQAIAAGILRKMHVRTEEVLCVAPKESSNMKFFHERGFPITNEYTMLKDAYCIILAVNPRIVGYVLMKISQVTLAGGKEPKELEQFLVSFSGVPIKTLAEHVSVGKERIVLATGSTNVRYNEGILVFSALRGSLALEEAKTIFSCLGKAIIGGPNEIRKGMALIDAMNTYDACFLKQVYENYCGTYPIEKFLKKYRGVTVFSRILVPKEVRKAYAVIDEYVLSKAEIITRQFGYQTQGNEPTNKAILLAEETLIGTMRSLLAAQVKDSSDIAVYMADTNLSKEDPVETYCRHMTLATFRSVPDLRKVVMRTHVFTRDRVQREIFASLHEAQEIHSAKRRVFGAFAKGYPL